MFPAFQANIAAYVVSLLANRLGQKMDLEKIWLRQDISPELKLQIQSWAGELNKVLHDSSGGRMISEWAKKPECWEAVNGAAYTEALDVPEIR
jgi:AIPR protein